MREFVRDLGGGRTEVVTLGPDDLAIGDDLADTARALASTYGRAAELVADLEGAAASSEAVYKSWRATRGGELRALDDKAAQWKIDQMLDADPDTGRHKEEMAQVAGDLVFLRGFQEGLRLKAQMLRVLTDNARFQLDLER